MRDRDARARKGSRLSRTRARVDTHDISRLAIRSFDAVCKRSTRAAIDGDASYLLSHPTVTRRLARVERARRSTRPRVARIFRRGRPADASRRARPGRAVDRTTRDSRARDDSSLRIVVPRVVSRSVDAAPTRSARETRVVDIHRFRVDGRRASARARAWTVSERVNARADRRDGRVDRARR